MRRTVILSMLLALVAAMPAYAEEGPRRVPRVAHYVGTDTNWFEPANWSTGQVPGEHTTVILDGIDNVVIDPALDPATGTSRGHVLYQDIYIPDQALLTTLPGTIMENRHTFLLDEGRLIHRSTETTSHNGNLQIADLSSMTLNPTSQAKRTIVLQGSVAFGLAGREPASPGHVGRGHYATMTADWVVLDGRLEVELLDGFTPVEGDTFQIVTATRAMLGQFDGLPEGALVARIDDEHGLFISYGRLIGPTGVTITLRQLSGG